MKPVTIFKPSFTNKKLLSTIILLVIFKMHGFSQAMSSIFPAPQFRHFTTRKGLPDNHVFSIFQDSRGLLWIGTANGLSYFDGTTFTPIYPRATAKNKSQNDTVRKIAEDAGRNILFLTSNGLWKLTWETDSVKMIFTNKGKRAQQRAKDIFIDRKKNIWIISEASLDEYNPYFKKIKTWETDTLKKAGKEANVAFKLEDKFNNIWFCYKGKLHEFTPENGIHSGHFDDRAYFKLLNMATPSITQDAAGNFWTVASNRLYRFNPVSSKLKRYTAGGNSNQDITVTNSDTVWIRSGRDRLFIFKTGANKTRELTNDLYQSGFPGKHVINTTFLDKDGSIWIGTGTGLYQKTSGKRSITFVPVITFFRINEHREEDNDDNIPYFENSISISYTAPNFIDPGDTHYVYRLEGFNRDWEGPTHRQYVSYTNLPGGNYQFDLYATVDGAKWSQMSPPLFFYIAMPFYKTGWFIVITTFSIFITFFFVIFFVQRVQMQRILMALKIRNNIAGDLHDDIGSSLSSIMMMSELARKKPLQASDYLMQINETAGKMIESMNDIVWAINPGNDSTEQMLVRMQEFASALLEKKDIALHFGPALPMEPLKMDMEQRKNFYLIFKETVHNAFKYSGCKNLTVLIWQDDRSLFLKIEDDGKGFDAGKKHMGNGLYNMQKRAAEINGSLQITSSPGGGASVLLILKTTRTGS